MKILVINAGSSSLKYQLIEMTHETVLAKGLCERIGQSGSTIKHSGKKEIYIEHAAPTHLEALEFVLEVLIDPEVGAIDDMSEIVAVGHRVLLSGEEYDSSVRIDDKVIEVTTFTKCLLHQIQRKSAQWYRH
jgi:acetate kinase